MKVAHRTATQIARFAVKAKTDWKDANPGRGERPEHPLRHHKTTWASS